MQKSRVRDLWKTLRGMDGLTDRQMILDDLRWDERTGFHHIIINVRPNSGVYSGGQFHFQVTYLINTIYSIFLYRFIALL